MAGIMRLNPPPPLSHPSVSQQAAAIIGGSLAGFGIGALLLIALTLLLSHFTHGQFVVAFFYGGSLVIFPIYLLFLIGCIGAGGHIAAQMCVSGGNRVPRFALVGYGSAAICTVSLFAFLLSHHATDTRQKQQRDNALRLRYGVLFYPNAVADTDYDGKMCTTDSLATASAFYKAVPGCDAANSANGGGAFIIPCRVSGAPVVYLRVNSRVVNNEPTLLIDTTARFEW